MAPDLSRYYELFPTNEACLLYLEKVRWNNKPLCPYCGSHNATPCRNQRRHHCNNCNTSYSVTVGTLFHKTRLDYQKWFYAINLIMNNEKNISIAGLSASLGVGKNTSGHILNRFHKAFYNEEEMLKKIVEGSRKRAANTKNHFSTQENGR